VFGRAPQEGPAARIGHLLDEQAGLVVLTPSEDLRAALLAHHLAGRTLADLCRSLLALAFIVGLGLLVGFRFHNSVGACVAGIALILFFGYAFTWVYASVGLAAKDPQTAQMAAILPMFILFFASSALVPVNSMPGWLQPFARNQPATVVINAVRALFEGGPLSRDLWQALAWCAAILVVFFVVSLNLYRKATA
jgi:ABC transporter DrrB family efflux protein